MHPLLAFVFRHNLYPGISSITMEPSTNHRINDKELSEKRNLQDPKEKAKFYKMAIYLPQKFCIRVSSFTNMKYICVIPHLTSPPKSMPVHIAHSFISCFAGLCKFFPREKEKQTHPLAPSSETYFTATDMTQYRLYGK